MKKIIMTAAILSGALSGGALASSTITPHTYTMSVVENGVPPVILNIVHGLPITTPLFVQFDPKIIPGSTYTWNCSPVSCQHQGDRFTTISGVPYGQTETLTLILTKSGLPFDPSYTYLQTYFVSVETPKISNIEYFSLSYMFGGNASRLQTYNMSLETKSSVGNLCQSGGSWCALP